MLFWFPVIKFERPSCLETGRKGFLFPKGEIAMNNQIQYRKPVGISAQGIRIIGLLLLLVGAIGTGIVQGIMMAADDNLKVTTVALVIEIVQCCALPLFVYLLVEGVQKTKSMKFYFLRVLIVAVLTEIPFDLINTGKVFDWRFFNPVFSLLICMVMLYLLRYYSQKEGKNILVKFVIVAVALLWTAFQFPTEEAELITRFGFMRESAALLSEGFPMVALAATLWFTRKNKSLQVFVGSAVMVLIAMAIPGWMYLQYMGAPLSMLVIHFYNGEPGEGNRYVNYLAYPVILMVVWLVAKFAF